MYRDSCQADLRDLRLRLKSIDSQQKTLMCNVNDDIYLATKDVYDKVCFAELLHSLTSYIECLS